MGNWRWRRHGADSGQDQAQVLCYLKREKSLKACRYSVFAKLNTTFRVWSLVRTRRMLSNIHRFWNQKASERQPSTDIPPVVNNLLQACR